jgi:acyl carrier protein
MVYVQPRNPTEEALAQVCAEVLGVERVGMQDNFFDMGGHSLAAAQFLARIRDRLGADLPLSQLFDTPTLGGTDARARRCPR